MTDPLEMLFQIVWPALGFGLGWWLQPYLFPTYRPKLTETKRGCCGGCSHGKEEKHD